MKKAIKIILLTPLALILLFLIVLSVKYSPVYVYRLITQNVADVYDYTLYESRVIKGSDSTFQFYTNTQEEYVMSLFQVRIK
ncbi:hypothetical protein ACE1ET_08005 [Saccharicrinis sp. FJH62]|uniref:hypothetical protein n=1 Tax=Saccharicrinis sp. FJH62 TaxID=3344657 RepID=UPI0035D505B1